MLLVQVVHLYTCISIDFNYKLCLISQALFFYTHFLVQSYSLNPVWYKHCVPTGRNSGLPMIMATEHEKSVI